MNCRMLMIWLRKTIEEVRNKIRKLKEALES